MNKFILRQSLILFLTALIWGTAFVAQSVGMEFVEPFTYNAVRSLLGGLVLLPYIAIVSSRQAGRADAQILAEEAGEPERKSRRKNSFLGGISCGVVLFTASNLQQFGIQYTTVGKAGFITAMYILLVPIMGLFLHKRVGLKIWIGVALAVVGLYLLCMENGFKLELGDALVLACAAVFAVHILVIDHFSPKADGVMMSCIQFWVCGILSLLCSLVFETPQPDKIWEARIAIGYAGVMSCGVAYTLQIVGQKGMNPTVASLILSLESVAAAVSGFLLLGQEMSLREMSGCLLMFAAIILAQLPKRENAGIRLLSLLHRNEK